LPFLKHTQKFHFQYTGFSRAKATKKIKKSQKINAKSLRRAAASKATFSYWVGRLKHQAVERRKSSPIDRDSDVG
jgi:hypothetical protein